MTVKEIVAEHLKANGFDGLCDAYCECGCGLENLFLCGEPGSGCTPGYKGPDPEGESPFLIYPSKGAAEVAEAEMRTRHEYE